MLSIRDLKIGHKFLLIGALTAALCLPPTALLVRSEIQRAQAASAEQAGVPALGALLRAIQLSQVHRGLSTNWLGGNTSLQAKREASAASLDQAMVALQSATAVYPGGPLAERQASVLQQWARLREAVASKSLDGPTGFQRHTQLVSEELRLLGDVADRSRLLTDPDAGSHYLIAAVVDTLPKLSEQLGQMRALGALQLKRGEITPAERATLQAALVQIEQRATEADRYFRNAAQALPELAATLGPQRLAAEQAVQAAASLVRAKLLDAAALDLPSADYFSTMTGHIDTQYRLIEASFGAITSVLEARVAGARSFVALLLAGGLLLGSAAAALMLWVALSTRNTAASAQAAAEALAEGKLDHRVAVSADDEIGRMARTLCAAMQQLRQMVVEIKSTGESVGTASAQIAAANADLSSRTEQTAANLQQAASAMEQLHVTVRNNADAARQATDLAKASSQVAVTGGELVGRVVSTMHDISANSSRIADIVGVIDGIAFQTNILALNAAVEAARAGEQGRGFAVVAAEVRSLAQRSASAAREIKTLINSSLGTVQAGAALVGQAQRTMGEIVDQARQVSVLVGEIGSASAEQTDGLGQVNQAVSQLDRATQQNAALVEESAAAAGSLQQQAQRLVESVRRFSTESA